MFTNLALCLVKGTLAFSCGSAAIYASTLCSANNLVSNLFSFIGEKKASRPADTDHPFGYGKEIYFWSFIASVFMLGFAGAGAVSRGMSRLKEPQVIEISTLLIIILAFTLAHELILLHTSFDLVKKCFKNCRFMEGFKRFRRHNNPVNKIMVLQNVAVVAGTAITIFAVVATRLTGNPLIDAVASIVVGLTLGMIALVMAYQLKDMIVGRSCNQATIQMIGDLAMKVPGVTDICGIKTMYMGSSSLLVNMEIQVSCDLRVDRVDDVACEVERMIRENVETVEHINIETVADDKVQGWKRVYSSQHEVKASAEYV
jgi:cation diffusion facilitator family transporter